MSEKNKHQKAKKKTQKKQGILKTESNAGTDEFNKLFSRKK